MIASWCGRGDGNQGIKTVIVINIIYIKYLMIFTLEATQYTLKDLGEQIT